MKYGTSDPFLDKPYSPAILAGLFDMSPSNIYQLAQRGIISEGDTYRSAIKNYLLYWKGKASGSGSIAEIAMVRKAELDRAKTIAAWYKIKQERGELVNKEAFLEQIEPIFHSLRAEMVAVTRKYPDTQTSIDKILNGLAAQGQLLTEKAAKQMSTYVEEEVQVMVDMEEEVTDVAVDSGNYEGTSDGSL